MAYLGTLRNASGRSHQRRVVGQQDSRQFTLSTPTAPSPAGVYVWASFKPKYHPDKADARKMGAGDLLEILWRMILVNRCVSSRLVLSVLTGSDGRAFWLTQGASLFNRLLKGRERRMDPLC